jgi:GxxExxY protein
VAISFCHLRFTFDAQKLQSRSSGIDETRANQRGMTHAGCARMEEQLDPQTRRVIGCAIAVHRFLGPGLLESVYRTALAIEMELEGVAFNRERAFSVTYRGKTIGEFHPDFIVQDEVVVEVKSVSSHDRVFDAQVLTYLRLTGLKKGLLLNFGRPVLKDGIKRYVL